MSVSVRQFRDDLRSAVPVWLSARGPFLVGFQILYVLVGLFDRGVQAMLEGMRAQLPGVDARTDNLLLIGRSRMRLQGETQSAASFLVTLRTWLTDLRGMGDDIGLAKELHRWLGGNPMVRLVNRRGLYTTVDTSGNVTQVVAAWNWDSVSNPERNLGTVGSAGYFDYWVIVYPTGGYYGSSSGHWGDGQVGAALTKGIGVVCTPQEIDTIRGLIASWKGAHVTPRTLIWSYDTLAFSPSTPTRAGNPDGTWGRWANPTTRLASRNRTHRYTSLGPERP